mmetsp:Transcript_19557/g.42239  ORF Transcript_19557/g.42239 Transcript_19557/m.42239 type:complete len:470 (-) Transcript_19557:378-1787(-)
MMCMSYPCQSMGWPQQQQQQQQMMQQQQDCQGCWGGTPSPAWQAGVVVCAAQATDGKWYVCSAPQSRPCYVGWPLPQQPQQPQQPSMISHSEASRGTQSPHSSTGPTRSPQSSPGRLGSGCSGGSSSCSSGDEIAVGQARVPAAQPMLEAPRPIRLADILEEMSTKSSKTAVSTGPEALNKERTSNEGPASAEAAAGAAETSPGLPTQTSEALVKCNTSRHSTVQPFPRTVRSISINKHLSSTVEIQKAAASPANKHAHHGSGNVNGVDNCKSRYNCSGNGKGHSKGHTNSSDSTNHPNTESIDTSKSNINSNISSHIAVRRRHNFNANLCSNSDIINNKHKGRGRRSDKISAAAPVPEDLSEACGEIVQHVLRNREALIAGQRIVIHTSTAPISNNSSSSSEENAGGDIFGSISQDIFSTSLNRALRHLAKRLPGCAWSVHRQSKSAQVHLADVSRFQRVCSELSVDN